MNNTKKARVKVQDINQISNSIATGNYYFVKRGYRKEGYIQATIKIDITTQIQAIIIEHLFRYFNTKKCLFCKTDKGLDIIELNSKEDLKFDSLHILACKKCQVTFT